MITCLRCGTPSGVFPPGTPCLHLRPDGTRCKCETYLLSYPNLKEMFLYRVATGRIYDMMGFEVELLLDEEIGVIGSRRITEWFE